MSLHYERVNICSLSVSCVTNLHEGEKKANSEVGEPVDGASNHEGCRPGSLPEHLSGHHVRNGTCGAQWLHVCPHPNNTTASGAPSCNQRVCVNNHRWVRLTGPYGMSYDVQDDTCDADVGHPCHRLLWTETISCCYDWASVNGFQRECVSA